MISQARVPLPVGSTRSWQDKLADPYGFCCVCVVGGSTEEWRRYLCFQGAGKLQVFGESSERLSLRYGDKIQVIGRARRCFLLRFGSLPAAQGFVLVTCLSISTWRPKVSSAPSTYQSSRMSTGGQGAGDAQKVAAPMLRLPPI